MRRSSSRRRCLDAQAADIERYEADVTRFNAPYPFSLWHDRAVLHFLTAAEDRRRYVQVLHRTLVSGGHVIIAAFAIGGPTRCSGLEIVQYDAAKLMAKLGADFHLEEQQTETHQTPEGKEQKFGFFRLRKLGGIVAEKTGSEMVTIEKCMRRLSFGCYSAPNLHPVT